MTRGQIEKNLSRALRLLTLQITTALGGIDDPQRILRILTMIAAQPLFAEYCDKLAMTFTTQLLHLGEKTWRDAARKASHGDEIYKAIQEELKSGRIGGVFTDKVRENAKLIKTIPQTLAGEVTDYIQSESLKGRRASDIAKDLQILLPKSAQSNVKVVARTEVSKTQTALTEARARNLGLRWYVWRANKDARLRPSHRLMDGVLVCWDDPPSPEALAGEKSYGRYGPGEIFNCRCFPEPVVNLDFIEFPCKVYYGGRIQRMTRKQFEKIA